MLPTTSSPRSTTRISFSVLQFLASERTRRREQTKPFTTQISSILASVSRRSTVQPTRGITRDPFRTWPVCGKISRRSQGGSLRMRWLRLPGEQRDLRAPCTLSFRARESISCPRCGMELDQQIRVLPRQLTAQPLASIRASISTARPLEAGQRAEAILELKRENGMPVLLTDLIEAHTEKIHLLIIDPALKDYHHEHPRPTAVPGHNLSPLLLLTRAAIAPGPIFARGRSDFRNTQFVILNRRRPPRL